MIPCLNRAALGDGNLEQFLDAAAAAARKAKAALDSVLEKI
jgi:hypothetical protein